MIRQAKTKDASSIHKLLSLEKGKVLQRNIKEIKKHIKHFIVYETGENTISGCVSFENYSPKIAEIRSLVVAPFFRKDGVGSELVKAAYKKARRGQEVFIVTSEPEFFGKLGFKPELNEKYILFKTK